MLVVKPVSDGGVSREKLHATSGHFVVRGVLMLPARRLPRKGPKLIPARVLEIAYNCSNATMCKQK